MDIKTIKNHINHYIDNGLFINSDLDRQHYTQISNQLMYNISVLKDRESIKLLDILNQCIKKNK